MTEPVLILAAGIIDDLIEVAPDCQGQFIGADVQAKHQGINAQKLWTQLTNLPKLKIGVDRQPGKIQLSA